MEVPVEGISLKIHSYLYNEFMLKLNNKLSSCLFLSASPNCFSVNTVWCKGNSTSISPALEYSFIVQENSEGKLQQDMKMLCQHTEKGMIVLFSTEFNVFNDTVLI